MAESWLLMQRGWGKGGEQRRKNSLSNYKPYKARCDVPYESKLKCVTWITLWMREGISLIKLCSVSSNVPRWKIETLPSVVDSFAGLALKNENKTKQFFSPQWNKKQKHNPRSHSEWAQVWTHRRRKIMPYLSGFQFIHQSLPLWKCTNSSFDVSIAACCMMVLASCTGHWERHGEKGKKSFYPRWQTSALRSQSGVWERSWHPVCPLHRKHPLGLQGRHLLLPMLLARVDSAAVQRLLPDAWMLLPHCGLMQWKEHSGLWGSCS